MKRWSERVRWAVALAMVAALAACGGGGGGGGSTTAGTSSGGSSGGSSSSGGTSGTSTSTTVPTTSPISSSGLITDQRVIGVTGSGYPAKGSSVTDAATGFVVTRVADKTELVGDYGATGSGIRTSISAIVYSRYTPVNTTGEYVLVHGDNSTSAWIYRVSDNRMMTVLRFKPSLGQGSRALGELNELRWDYSGSHPYRLYFVGRSLPVGFQVIMSPSEAGHCCERAAS